jgi:hypothetical protein
MELALKNKGILIAFIGLYLIRLLLTQTMGLMPQDAYYYYYSEHLALSYFDHPPMVAYMLHFFSLLFGKSVVAIKLTDFIVTLGTLLSFFHLSKFFLEKEQALKATFFFGSTLFVTILSINTTPDVPLMLFWTLTLLVFCKAVFQQKEAYWALTGLLIGLSFDSKYTALFLLFGVFFFLILSSKYRHLLLSRSMLWLLLSFVVGCTPVLLWNAQNEWVSLLFQSSDRATTIMKLSFRPKYLFGNLGTQILILLPPLFIGLLITLTKVGREIIEKWRLPDGKQLFLLAFSLPLLGFFFAVSFFYWVKLNWMMPGYIAAIILAGHYLGNRILNYQLGFALVLHFVALYQVINYPIILKSDDTWYGWEELVTEVETLQAGHPDHFFFSNDGYKTTAVLNFYLDKPVYAGNVIGEPGFQFEVINPQLNFLKGQDAFYLDSDKRMKSPDSLDFIPPLLIEHFDTVIQLAPILIEADNGEIQRKFWVFECRNYQGS